MSTPQEEATRADLAAADTAAAADAPSQTELEELEQTLSQAQQASLERFLVKLKYSEETHLMQRALVVFYARLDVGTPKEPCLSLLLGDCIIVVDRDPSNAKSHVKINYKKFNLLNWAHARYDALGSMEQRSAFVAKEHLDLAGFRACNVLSAVFMVGTDYDTDTQLPAQYPGFSAQALYEFDPYFLHAPRLPEWNERIMTVLTQRRVSGNTPQPPAK